MAKGEGVGESQHDRVVAASACIGALSQPELTLLYSIDL